MDSSIQPHYIMMCLSFIFFLKASHCIFSEDFYGFKAMHLVCFIIFFSGCTGFNEASNLGGWERSSFGRLRGTHCRFCECLVFRIGSVQPLESLRLR